MKEKRLLLTALFSALIIVGAYLKVPLPPVPITLQTMFVLLAGFCCGSRLALASTATYLLLGLIGLPVFSGGGGLGHLIGPTGGFLLGLMPAALVAGLGGNTITKEESQKTYYRLCLLFGFLATLVVYLAGVPFLKYSRSLSWSVAFKAGMLPFLVGDIVKIFAAAQLAKVFRNRLVAMMA